jgi:CO/xanthine dehydrogenase Mo-binding subunit
VERHMDVIARRIGLDPAELRRRNLIREGQSLATGQVVREPVDLTSLLDHALRESDYERKKAEHARFNRVHPYRRKAIGLSTFFHGSGFTGSGEAHLASEVFVDGLPDGRVEVLTAQTDMGQGTTTILAQIAADRLGLTADQVIVGQPDTSRVPNSGPTVASRTAMIVGHLIELACDDLLNKVGLREPGRNGAVREAIHRWHAEHPRQLLRGAGKYRKPESIQWDDKEYRGDAYVAYSWAADVAEVEVDLRTYQARVTDFVAVQEVGRVINPTLARGQVQGGVAQGIGWALYEHVALEDGVMKNCQMTNYVIPASSDLPPIRVFFEENPSTFGPRGAKGIGEMPIDGPAPAVINAVCAAMGAEIHEIPLTPEKLMAVWESGHGKV